MAKETASSVNVEQWHGLGPWACQVEHPMSGQSPGVVRRMRELVAVLDPWVGG